jgi:ribosomal protein S18 acetylase RimI-like enzyme
MPHPPPLIRQLCEDDAAASRDLRLRALREAQVPFLRSYEEEARRTVEDFASGLRGDDSANQGLGAFQDGSLVGTLFVQRHALLKTRHRASMGGMYVAPEARRRGVGRALLQEAISRLRAAGDIEQVELTVVRTEEPARRLYLSAGFKVQGVLRRAMKMDGEYFDEEELVLWLKSEPGP